MPAVRESTTDAFVLRFQPMVDFGVEAANITPDQIEHMMLGDGEEEAEAPRRRSQRQAPSQEPEFAFTNVDPFQ
jgi:hypothetical protein